MTVPKSLKEEAVQNTSTENLSLATSGHSLLLFDSQAVLTEINKSSDKLVDPKKTIAKLIRQNIYGFIDLEEVGGSEKCGDDVVSIGMAAARRGYGPVMYDFALSMVYPKYIIPDRGSVSSQAAKVWKYYLTNRPDVSKVLIPGAIDGSCSLPESEYDFKEIYELYDVKDSIDEAEYVIKHYSKKGEKYQEDVDAAQAELEELLVEKQRLIEVIKTYVQQIPLAYKYKINKPIPTIRQKFAFKKFSTEIKEKYGVEFSTSDYNWLGEEFFGEKYDKG